jgi:pimeloyl-ACP methyl ester carboxylesterase
MDLDRLTEFPRGTGRPTLVIPGFGTTNSSTYFMRRVLDANQHRTVKWAVQRNMGFNQYDFDRTCQQAFRLALEYGKEINVVGQSLGGCYARAVANSNPELINRVITLGTPINSIHQVHPNAIKKYNDAVGFMDAAVIHHTKFYDRFYPNPPVPCTSIYSESDGVVHWSQSLTNVGPLSENVKVKTSHFGMGFDAETLRIIAERLSHDREEYLSDT